MYAKCTALVRAQHLVDEVPIHDVVSWNKLIAGYVRHGQGKEALGCFHRMQSEGLSPNSITYTCILKACGIMHEAEMGEYMHGEIISQGLLEKDVVLGNALVDMYAKCGVFTKAQKVLEELPVRNVISWNGLMSRYVQHGQAKEAVRCFERMQNDGLSPNAITYVCILKACTIMQEVDMGKQIHDEITSQRLLDEHIVLGNALIDMYVKCGEITKAQSVLDLLPVWDVISWSTLIAGYVQQSQGPEALDCYERMRSEGVFPNAITYACILKACGLMQEANIGKHTHDEITHQGLLGKDVVLGNALVDMYAKCGVFSKAQNVLCELRVRDVVSWNSLIAGYVQHGKGEEALNCFQKMQSEGFSPNAITYTCVLKACGIMQDAGMGKRIHEKVASQGLLKKDVMLGNALVDMYAKCGVPAKAQQVLVELPVRDEVSWNSLIAGYTQRGKGKEALGCFHEMQSEGFSPNAVTYSCILKACGMMQEVDMGEQIHDEIVSQGLLEKNVVLCNALVDMYAKCGALSKAQKVFDELFVRDAVSWNALIVGYAQQGQSQDALAFFQRMWGEGFSPDVVSWSALIGGFAHQGLAKEALDCFQLMQREGIAPDAITFVNLLNACSHSGLVDEGQMLFDNMREKFAITPNNEHYTCMVDLLGRARLFEKAMGVIKMMPSSDYCPVWTALLGACRKWGNVKLGRVAFERAVRLDEGNAAAYVVMTSIYAAAGMQKEAQDIERMRSKNATWKQEERSCWVDGSGNIHKFVVGDIEHP